MVHQIWARPPRPTPIGRRPLFPGEPLVNDRSFRIAAGLVLLIAALLRVLSLGRGELWHDECGSVLMTQWPGGIWAAAAAPAGTPDGGNPPLYYYVLAGWVSLFGASDAAVRSLSVVVGVAQVAGLGLMGRAFGLAPAAQLGAMALGAAGSLSVFYGTEARAYGLLVLLLIAAMASWAHAARSGRPLAWGLHGAFLLLAWYTHNLALPFTAAFWVAAVLRGESRSTWRRMLGTHAIAAAAYLPWIGVTIRQAGGGAHEWIRLYWERIPQWQMIPRSLEAFGIGGGVPEYLPLEPPAAIFRTLSILVLAAAIVGLAGKPREDARPRTRRSLLAFLLVPLIFLVTYSNLKAPLYLIGRYDMPAWPAFAILFGLGVDGLLRGFPGRRRRVAAGVLVGIGVVLTLHAHRQTLADPAISPAPGPDSRIGAILSTWSGPDDLVVCSGFTTARVWRQVMSHELAVEVATYPTSLRDHIGWNDPRADLARGVEALRTDAAGLLARATRGEVPRLWFVFHPQARPGTPYGDVIDAFFGEVATAGLQSWFPEGADSEWRRLGVVALEPPSPGGG